MKTRAQPQLRDWRRFLADAGRDARLAIPLGAALFRANLRTQRRRTLLGHLWLVLPAAAAALAASYVQSRHIVTIRPLAMPYPVFVFAGTLFWQVLIEALNAPIKQIGSNRQLVTRMRFPHEALIFAGLADVLLNAAIRLAALLVLCLIVGVPVSASALLIPIAILALAATGLGLGLLIGPLGLLYDDVGRGVLLATNFLIFVMPVAYPIPAVGLQRFNPILPMFDAPRAWLIGHHAGGGFLAALLLSLVVFAVGWPFYRLAQPHVVARLG